ncbi:MAG: PEGA domain-containing protein [Calditrichaeota bacterium]|nr:MAG: PEGA domain-containing protein [Calditrichota bacterium]MBL1205980.1 PEGA domain-containing protein [Calditrichota bacterium]NOG45808.1 PEGA domain-containing protein [Calditrichota bacterium]
MSDKNKFNEDELRRKIREQLERKHSEKQVKTNPNQPDAQEATGNEEDESYFLEIYVRRKLQEEVFSRHAEFIKCGNHLDQIKWLTPLELEEEFEFFPLEYTFWERFRKKFSGSKKAKVPDTPEINKMIDEFRKEIEEDAEERIKKYKTHLIENKKQIQDDLEKKIFEEEQERFYRSKKGYHKYKNHINETTWMTREEFDHQDEFTDRVLTPMEKLQRRFVMALVIIGIGVGVYFISDFLTPESQKGYLIVDLNVENSSLYINQNLAIGFTPGEPYVLDEGEHEIAVISSGYTVEPSFQTAEISVGDTTNVTFEMTEFAGNMGVVRLNIPFNDATIFLDGKFKGTAQESKILVLETGDHSLTVKKENYIPVPQLHSFSLNAGDTIDLAFRLTPQKSKTTANRASSSINVGLIEVSSNVRDAQIILNGQKTGFATDYILQKIPFGQHIVRVEKEGYKIYPKEQVVKLSKDMRQAKVSFTMTSTSRLVTINVLPKKAKIIINGNEVASGSFSGSLPLGKHIVTFNDLEGYQNPGEQVLDIKKEGGSKYEFKYGSDIFYEIKPGKVLPSPSVVSVSSGYIMNGINFKVNSGNGPDFEADEIIGEKVWNMGFAFQYKNPPGTDAVLIRFNTPSDMNITKDVKLKLWLYESKSKYPLVLGSRAEYRVILNNVIIANHVKPKFTMDQFSSSNYEEISISEHLRAGGNVLIIAVDTDNAVFLKFWKAEIR